MPTSPPSPPPPPDSPPERPGSAGSPGGERRGRGSERASARETASKTAPESPSTAAPDTARTAASKAASKAASGAARTAAPKAAAKAVSNAVAKAAPRRYRRFGGAALGAFWYALLVVVLPITALVVLGLVALWRDGQLLALLGGWLGATLLGYAVFVNLPQRRARRELARRRTRETADDEDIELPEQLAERPEWSERDSAVWQRRCRAIERRLVDDPPWESLPELAVDELSAIAAEYHGAKGNARFRFTLPEALLVVSVASDRYRRVIVEHVPFADRVTVASLVTLRERRAQIERSWTWLNRARRAARLVNPIGAVVGELRDQFTNRVFDEASESLQQDLKRLVLQEIAQVGIDLYSGRLKVSDTELAAWRSRAAREDETRRVEAVEPLRVVLLGQVSAGKSSLVNALARTLEAEVDQLPTTDRVTVHALATDDGAALHLVDTPGIDEDPERRRHLVATAADADLLLWVTRATQPARAPDETLRDALERHFAARPERRMPPVLLALTHVDRLPPRAEWSPPYDLAAESGKGATMGRALASARAAIGFDEETPAVPVCLAAPPPRSGAGGVPDGSARSGGGGADAPEGAAADAPTGTYNVEAIASQIMMLAEAATLAQLNRRRVERGSDGGGWRARWRQTRRLGLAVGRSVVRHVAAREEAADEADAARRDGDR